MTIINNLDNDASNYQITLSEKTVSSIFPTSYVSNSSNELQYHDIELKELLVDSGASTQLISNIG